MDIANLTEEEFRDYLFKLWEPQDVNISNKELSKIRRKVDKIFFKLDSDCYETMALDCKSHILNFEEDERDYITYEEYEEELNRFISEGGSEKEFWKLIKEEKKHLAEIKIMKYRFKEKYSWKKISQEVGLSERQCQRIKDKILNEYILSMLEQKDRITHDWRLGLLV